MLLEKNDPLVLLLSADHPLLKEPSSKQKWMKLLQDAWKVQPTQPVQFQNTVYYTVVMNVKSNAYRTDFNAGVIERDELIKMCTKEVGSGIHLEMPHGVNPLFKFEYFLSHPKAIQLWKVVTTLRYVLS